MNIKHDTNSIRLTSSEVAYLWSTYIMDSKCKYAVKAVIPKIDDKDILEIMNFSVDLTDNHIKRITDIFNTVGHPIPKGFTEEDMNPNSEKLFSDIFSVQLLKGYVTFGLTNYGIGLSMAARSDVKQFLTECLSSSIELSNKIDQISINKGFFERTPYIPVPETNEFATRQSIMGSFFGSERSLNCLEISQVFNASRINELGQALLTAFAQATKDNRIKGFYVKGIKLIEECNEELNAILIAEKLNTPRCYVMDILNTNTSPFSEKMSLYFAITMIADMINAYSNAKSVTIRKDVLTKLTEHSMKYLSLEKDGMDIMLDKGWYEEFPKNVNREEVIKSNIK